MSTADTLRNLEALNPAAVRLAESVAFAIMIDRAFLRAARIALVPGADAGTEADLWFSPVVQSRTGDGIVLDPEVAEELRRRMSPERLEEVWSLTIREHAWLAPSLRLEEEVAYLSVSREPTAREQLADRLRSVLAAMAGGERAGLAQWAVRALAMFPSAVQELPEARMLDTGTRLRLGRTIEADGAETPFPDWLPWIAPASLGSIALDFDLREEQLEIRTASGDGQLNVPATNPLLLEVSWEEDESGRRQSRQITFRKDETATVPVGRGVVRLRTITGEEYDLREQDYVPAKLREEIIDFSEELARHTVIGREREIDAILAKSVRQSSIVIVAEQGLGKTAFLCALIREANRLGIPCVQHFFRFGDHRLESLASAERSLVAQLIARFGLPESMFGFRLPDVLQRMRLQQTPPDRLLIVIDDVDEARNVDREVVENALFELFKEQPASGCVLVSAGRPQPWAQDNHALQAPDADALFGYLQGRKRLDLLENSMPNYAEIELATQLGTEGPLGDIRPRLMAFSDALRETIISAAVALRPLNKAIFKRTSDTFLRVQDDDVEILNDAARRLVLETLTDAQRAEAHRRLVDHLESWRGTQIDSYPILAVDQYYLLNAPWHLRQAGNVDEARALCTSLSFMAEKIEKVGLSALIADFVGFPETRLLVDVLRLNATALLESPKDLPAILFGAFAPMGLADQLIEQVPLIPRLLSDNDPTPRQPLKHHAPIRGSVLRAGKGGMDALVTWSDDGTVKTWPNDASVPVTLEHNAAVVAFEIDYPEAVSADANGFLYLWNVPESRCISRVAAHEGAIGGMRVDMRRDVIVTWSGSDPIRLWHWAHQTGILSLGELAGHDDVVAGCSFAPNGNLLFSASRDKTCRLWSVTARRQIRMVTLSAAATGMADHRDSYLVSRLVTTDAQTLDIVQVEEANPTLTHRSIDTGHDLPVSGVAASSDRELIATCSEDQTVRLWDFQMASPARSILREHRAAVTACRLLSHSGPLLVTGAADGTAIAWDTRSGKIVSRFEGHQRAIRTISAANEMVYTAGDDGVVLQWTAPTGTLVADRSKVRGRVAECAVQASGDRAMITDGDTKASFIRLPEAEPIQTFDIDRPRLATSSGRHLVVYSADGDIAGYRIDGEKAVRVLPTSIDRNFIMAAAIAKDDSSVLGTSGGAVRLYSDVWFKPLKPHEGRVSALGFSDPVRFVVSAGYDGMLNISDASTAALLHSIRAHRSRILALAVGTRNAITGSAAGTLRVWDLESGDVLRTIRNAHDAEITGCDFAGDLIVTRSLDQTIRIHSDLRPPLICFGHRDTITRVAISLPERALYSCSEDRTIRRWNLDTGEQNGIIYGTAPFRCIAWAGGTLLAGDDGGNLWTVGQRTPQVDRLLAPSVFISYTSRDESFARRVYNDLGRKSIRAWFAPEDLRPGDRFRSRIDEAIRSHDKLLLILSADSVESDWVEVEVESALERERREGKDVLFPIAIDEAGFNSKRGWAADLRLKRHIADFRNWKSHDDYAAAFERLVRDLRKSRQDDRPDSPHQL